MFSKTLTTVKLTFCRANVGRQQLISISPNNKQLLWNSSLQCCFISCANLKHFSLFICLILWRPLLALACTGHCCIIGGKLHSHYESFAACQTSSEMPRCWPVCIITPQNVLTREILKGNGNSIVAQLCDGPFLFQRHGFLQINLCRASQTHTNTEFWVFFTCTLSWSSWMLPSLRDKENSGLWRMASPRVI